MDSKLAKGIQRLTYADLQELVLGMCDDSFMMRQRVTRCLDAIEQGADGGYLRGSWHDEEAAAQGRVWTKARMVEHELRIQRSLNRLKDVEADLGQALAVVMRINGTTPYPPLPIHTKAPLQIPAAHQNVATGQHANVPPAPWLPPAPAPPAPPPGAAANMGAQMPEHVCKHCGTKYPLAANHPTACRFHSGALRINPTAEVWAKKAIKNPVDTPSSRWLYPGGFKWDCCGQDLVDRPGRVNGCVISPHIPVFIANLLGN
ncbi:hypothetical protein GGR52DRAFT_571837 [Hypoxylon sp. FL1284]|nr:hypothetical protein GGR52DRAFT_571837 [Hypoxylon sp. FL1284]